MEQNGGVLGGINVLNFRRAEGGGERCERPHEVASCLVK